MKQKPTMLKKTSWLLFGRILSDGLAFLFYVSLARAFGKAGIGNYSFAFALAALFGLGVQFGLRPLITRNVAKDPALANQYCGNLICLQIGLTIVFGLALHLLSVVLGYSNQTYFLLTMAFIATALYAMGYSFVAMLEAVEAMHKSAILEVIAKVAMVAFGFSLILAKANLQTIMLAHIIGGFVYFGMAVHLVRHHFGPLTFKINPALIKTTLRAALPFVGASALYVLYARLDVMMIHHFIGAQETGAYAVAFRCIESSLVVAMMVGLAMYPVLTRTYGQAEEEFNQLFLSTLKWLGLLGMAGTVMLITVGDKLVVLLFGQGFAPSGKLIRWMAVLFLIGCIKVPYWRLLFATNRELTQLRIQGLSVGVNVVLNVFLIPRYGAYGAVWASITSEIVITVAFHLSCSRVVPAKYVRHGAGLILCGCLSLLVGLVTRAYLLWPVNGALTFGAFCASAVALGLIKKRERIEIVKMYQKFVGNYSPSRL